MSEHAYEELIRLLERDIIVPNQIMFTVAKVAEDLSVRKRNKLMKVYNHYNDLYNKKFIVFPSVSFIAKEALFYCIV